MSTPDDQAVQDANPRNWVDRWAPRFARPYLRLARADRPIPMWFLLWPCWWGLTLAAPTVSTSWPDPVLMLLFAVGAFVMRGAGCTYNDMVDRDFDAKVARTASRPIPSGAVSVPAAFVFLCAQCLIGLMVLLSFNQTTIWLGLSSMLLVAIYPFMKRWTYWPQIFLGLTFNWGALVGWTAVTASVSAPAIALYVGGILWTIGYDTIYAHQDKEDDALIGVKSSALALGDKTRTGLWWFYGGAFLCFGIAGTLAALAWPFYIGLAGAGAHLIWQIQNLDIDSPDACLRIFLSNKNFGWLLFGAILAGILF